MPWVESSVIESVTFDQAAGAMRITFKSGRSYEYSGVDKRTYQRFLKTESKGSFFNAYIRDRFPCSEI